MRNNNNIILSTDSYKLSHWVMYPPELRYLTSYLESRVGGEFKFTTFFGLQYLLKEFLSGCVVTEDDIGEAWEFSRQHFGGDEDIFNLKGWEYIQKEYDGRLPLKIRAVKEGTVVPEGNALLTVENTDPMVPWLVNHIETLLVRLWYPCTVATSSWHSRKVIMEGLERSSDNTDKLPFMLHDFGARGSTSAESAAIGGAAHLMSFMGTDNMEALRFIQKYYDGGMEGFSVPASEHSTITAWGKDRESEAYKHILAHFFNKGMVSVVSDSWDIYNACENIWGKELRGMVESNNGQLIIRPDSGEPEEVVPMCLNILGKQFSYRINDSGYAVLPDYIRIIQGDGISRRSIPTIIEAILRSGWSLENVVFGSGGGLLQDFNRDTNRFAMKCSAVKMEGDSHWRDVFKSPTGDLSKSSKKGYLYLSPSFTTTSSVVQNNLLENVFKNGEILINRNWLDINSIM